jgi:hypothetical protein
MHIWYRINCRFGSASANLFTVADVKQLEESNTEESPIDEELLKNIVSPHKNDSRVIVCPPTMMPLGINSNTEYSKLKSQDVEETANNRAASLSGAKRTRKDF